MDPSIFDAPLRVILLLWFGRRANIVAYVIDSTTHTNIVVGKVLEETAMLPDGRAKKYISRWARRILASQMQTHNIVVGRIENEKDDGSPK